MIQQERLNQLAHYVGRRAVTDANTSCTLSLFAVLLSLPAMANPVVLAAALFMSWRAWRLGSQSLYLQDNFEVASSYRTTATIGYWLGGCTFGLTVLISGSTVVSNLI